MKRLLPEATAEPERLPAGKELVRAYALWANSAVGRRVGMSRRSSGPVGSLSLARELDVPIDPFAPIRGGGRDVGAGIWEGSRTSTSASISPSNRDRSTLQPMGPNQLAEVLKGSTGPAEALAGARDRRRPSPARAAC